MKNTDDVLDSKKMKLANVGYYVEYLIDTEGNVVPPVGKNSCCTVICIGEDSSVRYVNWVNIFAPTWITLNWNCAPRRKKMENLPTKAKKSEGTVAVWNYYPTWQEFVQKNTLKVPHVTLTEKSPNDTFSP